MNTNLLTTLRIDFDRAVISFNHAKENQHMIAQAFNSGKAYGLAGAMLDANLISVKEYNELVAKVSCSMTLA